MPDIILKVVSVDAAPPTHALARSFDANGGTIGRDESNAFSLPDKHRRVSRLHATVSFPAGVPTITNSSTSLSISVGEQQLDFGESMPIGHGALIEVGPYVLQAHLLSLDAQPVPTSQFRPSPSLVSAALPPAVDRPHSGMTVVLPPPAVAHSTPPAYSSAPAVRPPAAPAIGAHFDVTGDLSDLLGGIGGSQARAVPPNSPPPIFATEAPAPAPLYVQPPTPVSYIPPAAGGHIPPASVSHDPFADLLAGIGGPLASPAGELGAGAFHAPVAASVHTTSGLSADPMAAFGASPAAIGGPADSLSGLGDLLSNRATAGATPGNFNPFDLPSSTGRNDADPLSSLLAGGGQNQTPATNPGSHIAPSIDSLFQAGPSGSSDASLFGFQAQRPATDGTLDSLIRSSTASDPLALFDVSVAAPAESSRAMRNDSLEMGSAFQPPSARQPGSPAAVASPVAAQLPFDAFAAPNVMPSAPATRPLAVSASVAPDVLTEAFLRGAGINASALPHGLTPEIMTTIGSLLRSATAGAIDMLAARAATKREVQASVTIISVQANNPLKFLPNADSALLQLLGKKMPGFMRADVAMKDAFEDLRAHEVGVIAGTRAALTEVLGKFDPAVLGDKLTKGSVLESVMPSARKAKLWDMYLERYLQIRREAEDDFQSIFGRAFVQAYELETARIKGDTSGSGGER